MPTFESTLFKKRIAFPETGPSPLEMPVRSLDVDFTEECTLRCTYCFKGDMLRRRMSMETAKQMVRWLVKHSGDAEQLHISVLGGEPMCAFDTLRDWMPFAVNYCRQRDKELTVGITSNLTRFTEEHLELFRFWHIGIHSSIDGVPEVQDAARVYPDGTGSSATVERNLRRIFKAWRTTHARSTVVPETVDRMAESFAYFLDKGFLKVAFDLAHSAAWESADRLEVLAQQTREVLRIHTERMKNAGRFYSLTWLDRYVQRDGQPMQPAPCGAGRGLLHVDVEGFLWPCHRFNGIEAREEWLIGHTGGGWHPDRRGAFLTVDVRKDLKSDCSNCEAAVFCGGGCPAANWQTNGDLFDPGSGYCKAMRVVHASIASHLAWLSESDPPFYSQLHDWVFHWTW